MTILTALLFACFGGDSLDAPSDPSVDGVTPRFACPDGAKYHENASGSGVERFCDRDGTMQGTYERDFGPDQRAARGAYLNSEPDSDWTWWHENGQESQKGKYARGKQVGAWTKWHDNGVKSEEGDYLSGRKAGTWTLYYPSSRKQETGIYHNDMKNQLWTYYHDDEENSVHRTELWEGGLMKEEKIINKDPYDPEKGRDGKGKDGKGKAKGR